MSSQPTPVGSIETAAAPLQKRVPALDGVRGLAILLVLGIHASGAWGPLGAGWLGVDLFFVLSGFLITGILWDARGSAGSLRAFYLRRVLRIFPLYYVTLAVALAAGQLAGREAWYLTYLTNVSITRDGWPNVPFQVVWSLSVEEQFYLVWPLILGLFPTRRSALMLCFTLVLFGPLVRFGMLVAGLPGGVYVLAPARMDTLAAGAALALLARSPGGLARYVAHARLLLVSAGGLLVTLMWRVGPSYGEPLTELLGYSLAAVAFASLVALTVAGELGQPMHFAPLRWLGRHSYAIYLWHLAALTALTAVLPGFIGVPLALLITGVAAWLSGRYFEAPILALKRYLPYAATPSSKAVRVLTADAV